MASTHEQGGISTADKVKVAAAAFLSVAALTGGLKSSPAEADGTPVLSPPPVPGEVYPGAPQYSQDPLTAQCETAALHSLSTGSRIDYILRHGVTDEYVRATVRGEALPVDCDGVVTRTFSTEETMNFGDKFYLNTPQTVIDRSNDAFDKSVVQRTRVPYHCGKSIQQIVHVEVDPTNGDPAMVNNFISPPVRAC